jgi:hypothetical protein
MRSKMVEAIVCHREGTLLKRGEPFDPNDVPTLQVPGARSLSY